jgi:DNA-binding GntR family transcriptional regulator
MLEEIPAIVAKDCMSDRIKRVLMQRISDGTYAPGERLIELQIAREFNTSQAPIREALCELEAMRVVETQPYKGTRVRQVSSKELQECLQIRAVLEQLAAELADDTLKEKIPLLKKAALETVEAAKQRDVSRYSEANVRFHRLIVECSNNETLVRVWDSLAPEVRMQLSASMHADKLKEGAQDHLDIVEAFAEGDNRFAAKLLRKHLESGLVNNLEESQQQKSVRK